MAFRTIHLDLKSLFKPGSFM